MMVNPETHSLDYFSYLCFHYYHWVDISAGGLLVPNSIIRPVFSFSTLI